MTAKGGGLTQKQFMAKFNKAGNIAIKVVGQYINAKTKIDVKCVKCKATWPMLPHHVTGNGRCVGCSDNPRKLMTNEEFLAKLNVFKPNIMPQEPYVTICTKIRVKCRDCDHIWSTEPHTLLKCRTGTFESGKARANGCPVCRHTNRHISHKEFMRRISGKISNNVTVLDQYIDSITKLKVSCKSCNQSWLSSPASLLKGVGCRLCDFNSCTFCYREYKLGGKMFKLQGYEHLTIQELIDTGIKASRIIAGAGVPWFKYLHPNGKERTYHPDLYIPTKELSVEVKSAYFAFGTLKLFKELKAKRKAVISSDVKYKLYVYDGNKDKFEMPNNWHVLKFKELRSMVKHRLPNSFFKSKTFRSA